MRLVLKQTAKQAADLEALLEQQRDSSSPDFQKWLTPEEFADRFGVTENDMEKLVSWLQSRGFSVQERARARNWITFSGTVEQIGSAFRTELRRYETDGELHFANSSEPLIPGALAEVVALVRGLDDFHPKPPKARSVSPQFNSASGAHYLAPDDLAAIYDITALYQTGIDGSGQKLAIAGQTDISLSDIRGFRNYFNLPARDPQLVLFGTDPGVSSGDQVEAHLDLEWSGAVARNATIVYVYSQDVFESVQYAIDQNLASVISLSYGGCEAGNPASFRTMAQQANAEGITWMNSSGDSGAAGCDYNAQVASHGPSATFPANIPEVTAVGGTEFNETAGTGWNGLNTINGASATGYLPEKAWNDTSLGSGIGATGGGASAMFSKPWWQTGPGVPNDQARDVPDISLSASADHDGYVVYTSGQLMAIGGTSASSPAFAGIVSLINQYVVSKGTQAKPGLGNINPNLYAMARGTAGAIHDITSGDNIVPCASGSPGCANGSFGYTAGAGYDLVTGLGSVDAYNLATKWTSATPGVGTTLAVSANPPTIAQSGTTQLTAIVTAVTGTNAPLGSVTFLAGTTPLGTVVLTPSGNATLALKGSSLTPGNNSVTATYSASGGFSNSNGSLIVTVTAAATATLTAVAANPASIAANGTTQLIATVKAAVGSASPAGPVTFKAGSAVLGTATLSAGGIAVLDVSAKQLTSAVNQITAIYGGNGIFGSSTSAALAVTVAAPLLSTTTSVTVSPSSIAPSGSTVVTVTVRAASGPVAPAGSVAFAAGGIMLGSANLAPLTAGAGAAFTIQGKTLAAGNNTITATYAGTNALSGSSASVVVTVTQSAIATAVALAASPLSISQSGGTQLTATVRASAGAALPLGRVSFKSGRTALGDAPVMSVNGSAVAVLTIGGNRLVVGSNSIVASFSGSNSYTGSSASVNVTVTAATPSGAALTSLAASPASIVSTGSTQLIATVKPGGNGRVTFTVGSATLGSAAIAANGSAILTVQGSALAAGSNTITATYASSIASVAVNVTAPGGSNVVATAIPAVTRQRGYAVMLKLQEQAGVPTAITGMTINGADYSSAIAAFFGTTHMAAHATLTANPIVQWRPLPAALVFAFTGVDANGRQWSQSVLLNTVAN